ncbi:MAG: hypothetical protein ABIZ04_12715 [Opitutus sp.]
MYRHGRFWRTNPLNGGGIVGKIFRAGCVAAVLMIAFTSTESARAQDWPFAVPVEHNGQRALGYLWIAPQVETVRGLIICVDISAEAAFVRDPTVRAAATNAQLGIVFISPGLFATYDVTQHDDLGLQRVLDDLARVSGFREIATAPLLTFGHSTGGIFARNVAYRKPERVFGVIYFKSGQIRPPTWPHGELTEIPFLAINGEFEEFGPSGPHPAGESWESQWTAVRDELLRLRRSGHRVSQIVEPGGGHWGWTQGAIADHVAKFITLAAQQLPAHGAHDEATVPLRRIREEDGTLAAPHGSSSAAAVEGDSDSSPRLWHASRELAEFSRGLESEFGRAEQSVAFENIGSSTPDRDVLAETIWNPDGTEFCVRAHASSGLPVEITAVGGPVEAVAPGVFRVIAPGVDYSGFKNRKVTLAARQTGDVKFRPAVRIGTVLLRPHREGRPQMITFAPLVETPDHGPISLHATADSALPVQFRIRSGPAEIVDGAIVVTELPRGEASSFEIVVLAGQWGNAQVQTATTVEQRLTVHRVPARP